MNIKGPTILKASFDEFVTGPVLYSYATDLITLFRVVKL